MIGSYHVLTQNSNIMEDNEENIPPFVQDYLDKMDYEGYGDFVKLSRDYNREKMEYPARFAQQSANLQRHNQIAGTAKTLNYDNGLKEIEAKFQKEAYQTAKQHGFKGRDPNEPTYGEFDDKGDKFNTMIDRAKQREEFLQQVKKTRDSQQQDRNFEI